MEQQCIAFLSDNAGLGKPPRFPGRASQWHYRGRMEGSQNAKRVSSVSRIGGRTEVILGAQQYHMWFVSILTGTSLVHGMTYGFPSHLSGGAACQSSFILSHNLNFFLPPAQSCQCIYFHGFHSSASPHTGMHFHKNGYLAILYSTFRDSLMAHLMLNAIRGLSSRFCQGLFLSSPWSSSSSSSSSSSLADLL